MGLGEGIKRNFTQHPLKMARQILFELIVVEERDFSVEVSSTLNTAKTVGDL